MLELVVVWWSGGVEWWWMELRNANAVSAIYNTSLSPHSCLQDIMWIMRRYSYRCSS